MHPELTNPAAREWLDAAPDPNASGTAFWAWLGLAQKASILPDEREPVAEAVRAHMTAHGYRSAFADSLILRYIIRRRRR